jgi:hypothetical protein
MYDSRGESDVNLARFAAAVTVLAGAAHAAAPACSAQSPPHTVALVELYTSDGCDSCPPADRWLSSLLTHGFTPGRLVPLALHLDWRDYVGWKDEDARQAHAARRYKLARLRRPAIVYTPQVLLQGRDFPGWSTGAFATSVAAINAQPPRASLALAIRSIGADGAAVDVAAEVADPAQRPHAALYVAAYEDRLAGGGEPGHDFVVQEWLGPVAFDAGGRIAQARTVPLLPNADPQRSGVAAFVENRRTAEVLQALMVPPCGR